jgi:predicted small metal-binding protein
MIVFHFFSKKGDHMKKSLTCADMGITSCSFEARSEKPDEIKDALFTHFTKYHPADAAKIKTDQQRGDMLRQMDQKIH